MIFVGLKKYPEWCLFVTFLRLVEVFSSCFSDVFVGEVIFATVCDFLAPFWTPLGIFLLHFRNVFLMHVLMTFSSHFVPRSRDYVDARIFSSPLKPLFRG